MTPCRSLCHTAYVAWGPSYRGRILPAVLAGCAAGTASVAGFSESPSRLQLVMGASSALLAALGVLAQPQGVGHESSLALKKS